MSDDLSAFLKLLKSHNVDFLIVGSHVLAAYARPRFTEDLDIWVGRRRENLHALGQALREFGFAVEDSQMLRLESGRHMIRMGHSPNRVDILNFLGSAESEMCFETSHKNGIWIELFGQSVPMLTKEDFIASKRSAGRRKDLRDLEELEEG